MHQLKKVCEMKRKYWASSEENPVNRDVSEDPEVASKLETEPMPTPPTPQEYCISNDKSCKVECPAAGSPGAYAMGRAMRIHFRDRHTEDIIVVKQEGH
jgi:hypothetical protein